MLAALCFRDSVGGHWLRSRFMNRLFFLASFGAFLFVMEFVTASSAPGLDKDITPPLAWVLLLFTAFACLSWMTIHIGMIYYWLIHDRRRSWWGLAVGAFGLLAVLYYFLVYREDLQSGGSSANAPPSS